MSRLSLFGETCGAEYGDIERYMHGSIATRTDCWLIRGLLRHMNIFVRLVSDADHQSRGI